MKRFAPLALTLLFLTACSTVSDDTVPESVPVIEAPVIIEDAPSDTMEDVMVEKDAENTQQMNRKDIAINLAKSTLTFVGGSSIIDHDGSFERFVVTYSFDEEDAENMELAQLDVLIDVSSVQTDTERLTAHLMKEDFFDVENYPEAVFFSSSFAKSEDGEYDIFGELTIKGIAREVILHAVITDKQMIITYDLPRKEFMIGNDSYGDKILDEFVPIQAVVVFE